MIVLLRANRKHIQELANENLVGYGWSDANFEECTSADECLKKVMELDYTDLSGRQQGVFRGQFRILTDLKEGDYVVVPSWGGIYLAKVTKSGFSYSPAYGKYDQANTITVEYQKNDDGTLRNISRTELTEGLQRRLKFKGTLNRLAEFQEELQDVIENKTLDDKRDEQLQSDQEALKTNLMARIRGGRTAMKSGGLGLEELIKELLEIQGYDARILGKKTFSGMGDADVVAERTDPYLGDQKLLVQVKHHQNITGEHMLKQLVHIHEHEADEWGEYNLIAITSADVSEELRKKYEGVGQPISAIIAGEQLAEMIYENINKFSPETLKKLGIVFGPRLLGKTI
ncbi:restriction endonuclease [Persicirhabdus sediminis]|uniref:Restriction endonuclease n=1 Tax=Persicirhabdus sediminis TaxID=454144 RepID=A0A8J7MGC3_9BACT|nr:restriction endonuclease [Persicirhabdus sediminis]MBK1792337.1 restriction endonuclease [Persicirhabdus sediminis]